MLPSSATNSLDCRAGRVWRCALSVWFSLWIFAASFSTCKRLVSFDFHVPHHSNMRVPPLSHFAFCLRDGTLTRPGQIDFKRIHARLNIPDAEDILSFIEGMRSAAEREAALAVVEEEEMRGFIDVQLQEGAEEVVAWLREERGMQVALATRNNAKCVEKLVELCNFHPSTISSSMHDLSLNPSLTPSPFSSSSSLASSGSFHPILTRVFKSAVDVDKLLAVSELWGLAPSSILVVGDSLGTCEGGRVRGNEGAREQGAREKDRQTRLFGRRPFVCVLESFPLPLIDNLRATNTSSTFFPSSLFLTPLSRQHRGLSMGTYGRHEVLPNSYRCIPHARYAPEWVCAYGH